MMLLGILNLYVIYVFFAMTPISTTSPIKILPTNKTTAKNIIFSEDNRSNDIIFPEDDVSTIPKLDVPTIPKLNVTPKCANKRSTYCENVDAYPHRYVREILRNAEGYNLFFGKDEIDEDLVERTGDTEKFICNSVARVIFPQGAKNSKNEWRFIVNQADEGYVQGIRVEECFRANVPCDIVGTVKDGIETSCKQKYIYRRLLAISDDGKPTVDTFLFPSACCCSYKNTYGLFWDRFLKMPSR